MGSAVLQLLRLIQIKCLTNSDASVSWIAKLNMDREAGSGGNGSATSSRPSSGNDNNKIPSIHDDEWLNNVRQQLDNTSLKEKKRINSSKSVQTDNDEDTKNTAENSSSSRSHSRATGRYKVRPPDHPFLAKLASHRHNVNLTDYHHSYSTGPSFLPPIPGGARRVIRPFQHQTFPIYVETLTGTVFEVTCSTFETIHSIKDKIYRLEGIPISRQHLIFRQAELKDNDQSIGHAGIVPESKLTLILDVKGGPINASANRSRERLPFQMTTQHEFDIIPIEEAADVECEDSHSEGLDIEERLDTTEKPDMIFHTYHNGNAVLILSYSDQNLPPPISPTDIYDRSRLRSREHFTKTAANLIDDSKMNLKVRNLRQKMLEKKLEREARRKSKLPATEVKSSNTSLPPLKPINSRIKLPLLPQPPPPSSIRHNHDTFLSRYNLTSPREIETKTAPQATGFLTKERLQILEQLKNGGARVPSPTKKPRKKKKAKCSICGKRIPLGMEFSCRCELVLCANHRTAEAHQCSFDYKNIGRQELKKDNPLVTASKLPKLE